MTPVIEPGYTPSLLKPAFAENRDVPDRQTRVGEWGPKTDSWWLRSTGTVRSDHSGRLLRLAATKTVEFTATI